MLFLLWCAIIHDFSSVFGILDINMMDAPRTSRKNFENAAKKANEKKESSPLFLPFVLTSSPIFMPRKFSHAPFRYFDNFLGRQKRCVKLNAAKNTFKGKHLGAIKRAVTIPIRTCDSQLKLLR